jgi:hypothetical protein
MTDIIGAVIPFSPKPEDLRFFSIEEGVVYARNAGFTVTQGEYAPKATRADMPDVAFKLIPDTEKPERFVWVKEK